LAHGQERVMATIERVTLRRLCLPLVRPYRLSYRTFEAFEPFMVEVQDSDGRAGFADGHISPGSSSETREGGWAFLLEQIARVVGQEAGEAKSIVLGRFAESKVATTALVCAIEAMEGDPLLEVPETRLLSLLTPINALEEAKIAAEVESGLAEGFRTFKIKVGKDVKSDLARLRWIQKEVGGRATLRLDANRAYSRDQALDFVSRLDPEGIELFEQPCDAEDWEANAAVAARCPVPLMLDEPICTLADIDRAAEIQGVGYCKLKLKRFGGLGRLKAGLEAVRANGLEPVLGDGLGSEIHCWLEACVAQTTIRNAGEFNGFLKARERLFAPPLPFENGTIRLEAGYRPQLDRAAIDRCTVEIVKSEHPHIQVRKITHGA
jgi:L-Ala-D/L-Glu epimerase